MRNAKNKLIKALSNNRKLKKVSFLLLGIIVSVSQSNSQCSRTAPAAVLCPIISGTAIIADGVTNNNVHGSGAIFYYNGAGGTAKITMTNDGILDICGSLTVTASSTFNLSSGGTIQVESGGNLTINSDVTLNNTGQIVNRGTLTINGNVSVTNINATIWNLPGSLGFTIGAGKSLTMLTGYFIESAPFSSVTIPTLNLSGGILCMGDNTNVNAKVFTNNTTNSVLYNGTTLPACLSVSTSAQIGGHTLTNSSKINVSLATGFSYTSGTTANWGSATVTTNSGSCSAILPLNIVDVTANNNDADRILINWNTVGNFFSGESFDIQESDNGVQFHSIGFISANQNENSYSFYDSKLSSGTQYYRVKLMDPSGTVNYSSIVEVHITFALGLSIFPNPVARDNSITIVVNAKQPGNMQLSLTDISGKCVKVNRFQLNTGHNQIEMGLNHLVPGLYIFKTQLSSTSNTYGKLLILPL
jgi:hypothetical protein